MTETSFMSFDIIVLGIIAAVAIVMLRSVLGKKTGNEETRARSQRTLATKETPEARDIDQSQPMGDVVNPYEEKVSSIDEFAKPGSPLAQALTEIQLEDSSFDPGSFVSGANAAYEMIISAFAAGDKKILKPLLSDDVFGSFAGVVDGRKTAKETIEQTFIGISSTSIAKAAVTGKIAEITIKFICELISVTKNSDGAVIQGDPNQIFKVTDIWTFSRDTTSKDPNWRVSATISG